MPDPALPVPPAENKPASFRLPLLAWLAWALCAGICVYLSLPVTSAYEQGQVIGILVGMFLLPTLAGWILWRIAGRSATAGKIGFSVMLALVFSSQFAEKLDRRNKLATAAKLEAVAQQGKAELLAALDKDGSISAENRTQITDKAFASVANVLASAKGEDREVALGLQAYLDWAKAGQAQQTAAIRSLDLNSFFDLAQHATAEQRQAKRAAIRELKAANVQLRGFVEGGAARLEQELTQRKVSAVKMRSTLAGYADSTNKNLPHLLAIREQDEQFASLLDDFISFAETLEGRWSKDKETGQLLLPDDAAVIRYNALLAGIQEVGERQAAAQRLLLSGGQKN